MSDEQTRLLQQILEIQREALAFSKQYREEMMALQRTALAGQRKSLWMSRLVILFMVLSVGIIIAFSVLGPIAEQANKPEAMPVQKAQE